MGEYGYEKTTLDHCVFVKKFPYRDFLIYLLYVGDMFVNKINKLKIELSKSFAMKE